MPTIGLVGPSYQESSLPFDAQRSVNLYPVIDPMGKEKTSLYGTPGLKIISDIGVGPIRASFSASNGRSFVISGSGFFEVSPDGTSQERGSVEQSSGLISIDENGFQMAICDGESIYIFTYKTNVFEKVVSPAFGTAKTVVFLDGYFIVNQNNAGTFYISNLFDGTKWNDLDFASAESSPDNLLRCYTTVGQLWLLGGNTTEIWTNTGDSDFPFERISGSKMETGILAPHSALEVNNALFWLGKDKKGTGIVYTASGFTPQRISTHAIEQIIRVASNKDDITSYTYQENGHVFYVLTGGGLKTSLVYDVVTQSWHERSLLGEKGQHEQHIACCHMLAFGKHVVGSRVDGKIYDMSLDYYDDDGREILRERIYTHLIEEDRRLRYNRLVIGFEVGIGSQSGQGQAPLVTLQLSKDGARTWSASYTTEIGKVGKYKTKAVFRRLGIAEQMTFRIKISDPVKVAITGSYVR